MVSKTQGDHKLVPGLLAGIVFFAAAPFSVQAIDLREATFTEVINTVSVTNPQANNTYPAKVNSKFITPEIIRTGASSRAELTAADQTVTRIGANTIFSFKPQGRGINLQQGSVLFNSPSGRGGGTIQTAAATASVIGTTIIVSTTRNGGFKLLVLEGKAKATLPNGRSLDLKAGQMTFILPGMTTRPQVFEFRLSKQNEGSDLVHGFKKPLPAQDKIIAAITLQNVKITNGDKTDTGLMIGEVVGNEVQVIDPNTLQTALDTQASDTYAALIAQFQQALTVDRTISAPTLTASDIIYFPTQDALRQAIASVGDPGANNEDIPDQLYGLGGKNIYFQTTSGSVNLSSYDNGAEFAFYASQSIQILSSLSFGSFSNDISLRSLGSLSIGSGLSVTFNTPGSGQLTGNDPAGINLSYVALTNNSGQIGLENMNGPISLIAGSFTGTSNGGSDAVDIEAKGDISLTGTLFNTSGPANSPGVYIGSGGNVLLSGINYVASGQSFYIGGYNTSNNLGYVGGAITFSGSTFTVSDLIANAKGNITSTGTNFNVTNGFYLYSQNGQVTLSTGTFTGMNGIGIQGSAITSTNASFIATAGDILFDALGPVSVTTSTFTGNNVVLSSSTISMTLSAVTTTASNTFSAIGGPITSTNGSYFGGGSVSLTSNGNLNSSNDFFYSPSGNVNIHANSGNINMNGSNVTAATVTVAAVVGSINLVNGNFTANNDIHIVTNANNGTSTISGTTFTASGGSTMLSLLNGVTSGTLEVSNTTFSGNFNQIAMSAYTINLSNVSFASGQVVYLTSGVAHGYANFGSSVPGWVNFISGVSYGGSPVTSSNSTAFSNNGGNIHVN